MVDKVPKPSPGNIARVLYIMKQSYVLEQSRKLTQATRLQLGCTEAGSLKAYMKIEST